MGDHSRRSVDESDKLHRREDDVAYRIALALIGSLLVILLTGSAARSQDYDRRIRDQQVTHTARGRT